MQLQLETINVCKAQCLFCHYPQMKRKKGMMSWDLFRKIIDEAKEIPLIHHLTLTGLGETLLDPYLIDRIRYMRRKMAAIEIDLFTSGNGLTTEMVDKMARAGMTTLYVSLNATDARTRKEIMGLDDYEQVVDVCKYAISKNHMRTIVKAVASKDLMEHDARERFMKEWGGPWTEKGNAFLHLEGNWAGFKGEMRVKPRECCHRALTQIMVLWDGRVALCCFDGEGRVIFGDLNDQTIREVYNGEKYLAYREAHNEGRRQELFLCQDCTSI